MKTTIEVTQADIDRAVWLDGKRDHIANALSRKFPGQPVFVDVHRCEIGGKWFKLPRAASRSVLDELNNGARAVLKVKQRIKIVPFNFCIAV
jgi:hypothetical protein